jgi:phosphoenolpyruvate carboxykinase (ATP)
LPLHPTKYAELLGHKLQSNPSIKVWLLNTGFSGGAYGVGKRMSLPHTRALITSALTGKLNEVSYEVHPIFGLQFPTACDGVPAEVLNPRNTWSSPETYDIKAAELAKAINNNFKKFEEKASDEIKAAAPKVLAEA